MIFKGALQLHAAHYVNKIKLYAVNSGKDHETKEDAS